MTNEEIAALLLRAPSWNTGTVIPELNAQERAALKSEAMIGANDGLTMKGSVRCERAKRKQEKELFGF